jgi:hypothetical protein
MLNEHHGLGLKLGYLMPEQYGPTWPLLQAIKDTIDPLGIMNPGKQGFRVPEFLNQDSEFWRLDQETKKLATERFGVEAE